MSSGDQAILIRAGRGDGAALFFVHDELGSLAYAEALAPHLNPALDVYGLPPALPPHCPLTLSGLAVRISRMILDTRVSRPYRIVGYASGQLFAYESAVQLLGADQPVQFVGLIDAMESLLPTVASREAVEPSSANHCRMLAEAIDAYEAPPIEAPTFLFAAPGQLEPSDAHQACQRAMPAEWLTLRPVPSLSAAQAKAGASVLLARVLSDAIHDAEARKTIRRSHHDPLVVLQRGGDGGPPMVCVPGAGATVVSFSDLVGRLDRGCRVYGIQPRGMDGSLPHTSVAAAAGRYLAALGDVPDWQPIHLVGHSFGGWVVYEMACLLIAAERKVASVTMIDTAAPAESGQFGRQACHVEMLQQWINLFEMSLGRPLGLSAAELRSMPLDRQLIQVHARLQREGLMPRKSDPAALRGPFQVFAAAMRSTFVPRVKIEGAVHLVTVNGCVSDELANQRSNECLVENWQARVPELEVFCAPGNHMTVLKDPQVAALVEWLAPKLCTRVGVRISLANGKPTDAVTDVASG